MQRLVAVTSSGKLVAMTVAYLQLPLQHLCYFDQYNMWKHRECACRMKNLLLFLNVPIKEELKRQAGYCMYLLYLQTTRSKRLNDRVYLVQEVVSRYVQKHTQIISQK